MKIRGLALLCCWLVSPLSQAETIKWFSAAGATNQTSTGSLMSAQFKFELGVFQNNFVPTAGNMAQWATNWAPAQESNYSTGTKRFDAQFTVTHNTAPFTVGKAAYVWGSQTGTSSSEWILFRNPTWTWPAPNPLNPFGVDWDAEAATAIIGQITPGGSPALMKSASVTTWQQWQITHLAGEPLNAANDDPDHDGQANLAEFVYGTPPLQAGPPVSTPVEIITDNFQQFLQVTYPRRLDHLAILTVESSPDLNLWTTGTTTISSSSTHWTVRANSPLSSADQQFLRLGIVNP